MFYTFKIKIKIIVKLKFCNVLSLEIYNSQTLAIATEQLSSLNIILTNLLYDNNEINKQFRTKYKSLK